MLGARRFAVCAAALLLPACAASYADNAPPAPAKQASWAMFQHSPDRNAVFPQYSIPHDWTYPIKAKVNGGFALVGNTLLFTAFSHRLIALDVRDGHELWSAPLSNIAMSTPIVAGNTVYVSTGRNGLLHRNLLQRIQFHGKDVWGVPGGDEIAAFDLRTGKPRWTYRTVGEDMPSPAYYRGRLIFANGDWHAYGVSADTGRRLWSTDLGGVSTMASALVAQNEAVVAVCTPSTRTNATIALDPASGRILWRSPYGYCDAAPTYADGTVFVSTVKHGESELQPSTVVAALDARTGKTLWTYAEKQQGLWSIVSSAEAAVEGSYANGTYYQSAPFTDKLLAFDAKTGAVRWTFHTSGPIKMSPVVYKGRVYVGDIAGLLYTLDARDGSLLELREFKQPFTTTPPIVAGNKLIVVNGTSVDAMPLTGRPAVPKGVGWAVTPRMQKMLADK